ncbi:RNA polymerase factor sigma-54 [Aquibium sp. LZ166]|uniref:RNA polymerase sigma-54 factor n=1 Tax=Aquibium pacificus TaxID=3153579 RepID=A0ABV3SFW1_9HYPH
MALAAKLQLRQSQALVMTPQLMQSIRLLQFTHAELERFIDDEIERNPLLERRADEDDRPEPEAEPPPEREADGETDWFASDLDHNAERLADRLDSSLENLYPDDPGTRDRLSPDLSLTWKSAAGSSGSGGDGGFDLEDVAAAAVTLRDSLTEQIAFGFAEPVHRIIASELADSLDDSGYIRDDLAELALRLGIDRSLLETVLIGCQNFDPPGLFARNLSECLAIQLKRLNRLDPAMQVLLNNLDLLARRDFVALRRLCGVDEGDLIDMLGEIKALDPKPGAGFTGQGAETIVPDVVVRPAPDGTWAVELNPDTLPRVLVDQTYLARISSGARSPADKEFLSDCMQSASWLTRSLDQRARTIVKVASEIVRQQDAFLMKGIRHLRPLNLKTVAEAIQMHESTVSRVTANKYMQTPRGVFELRFFFTAAIASAEGGDAHSAQSVRHRIRQMIDEEKPSDVLSDDAIVDVLRKSGIDIARRTVAKYREGMNIPSSVQRRREKRAMAGAM